MILIEEKVVELVQCLEVINDVMTATLEFYNKLEQHFQEPTDSNKLKILIKNSNKRLLELIDEFYKVLNNH